MKKLAIFMLSICSLMFYKADVWAESNSIQTYNDGVVKVTVTRISENKILNRNVNLFNRNTAMFVNKFDINKDMDVIYENKETVKTVDYSNKTKSIQIPIHIPLTKHTSNMVTRSNVETNQKTGGGVTATLSVDYDISHNNDSIKVNKYYGDWKVSHSMYYVTNRNVGIHNGMWGRSHTARPTSDSFFYNLNWGYNSYIYGAPQSPRVWSEADCRVAGMDGVYRIKVEYLYGD